MRKVSLYGMTSLLVALAASLGACGDDADDQPTGPGGPGTGGDGNNMTTGGTGGTGAGGNDKPTEEVSGEITSDTSWTSDKNYLVKGRVRVSGGATLTIEAGTTVFGDKATKGSVVITPDGQIDAVGTADEPIVFTSQLPAGQRVAGDWGGLVILGQAPINEAGGSADIEGFENPAEEYGGTNANHSSGVLSYVRIEFSGIELSTDNEINGLTLGGVGRGTQIDHVMVRHTLDDCFEFFGGTVDASHLICYRNGDDAFDFDQGYVGNLQFLFLQQDPSLADDTHGFESDNDAESPDATPLTNPTIWNVTLCGQNATSAKDQFGFVFRRGFNATIGNAIVTGFDAGVDIRDRPYTDVTMTHSIFYGNLVENIAFAEDGSNPDNQADDDMGFDEVAWFTDETTNSTDDPDLADCFAAAPDPRPSAPIAGGTPPSGFDTSATYVGAFEDESDDWATGAWVDWSAN